jgi:hypothetical protein
MLNLDMTRTLFATDLSPGWKCHSDHDNRDVLLLGTFGQLDATRRENLTRELLPQKRVHAVGLRADDPRPETLLFRRRRCQKAPLSQSRQRPADGMAVLDGSGFLSS